MESDVQSYFLAENRACDATSSQSEILRAVHVYA
jgi:hypothetical protein